MERYVDGDAHAFDELFHRFEKRAFAFFVKRTGSPDRAQDLYQELFLRIHRARGAYDASRAFAPWLFQIAHNLLIDDRRRAYRSHEVSLGDSALHAAHADAPDVAADREQLFHLLGSLSESERWVFLSAKGEGVGYAELAAQLGKSVDAVKKMASRTLQRLQRAALADSVAPSGGC
ncbi:MAG TPA: RNA polymerase sigma factor [Myxococcota bacterium]|nr:RNA polymerase sigma factor [Myxococcota bacterium]